MSTAENYEGVVYGMRSAMFPVLGAILPLILLLFAFGLFHKQSKFLLYFWSILLYSAITQLVRYFHYYLISFFLSNIKITINSKAVSVMLLTTPQYFLAAQLMITSLFGIFSVIILSRSYVTFV